jgi:hypothetical protein
MSKENKKYEIDVSAFPELQDAIMEYFLLMTEIMNKEDLTINTIKMDVNSDKILIEGHIEIKEEEPEEPSEEDSDWEWV